MMQAAEHRARAALIAFACVVGLAAVGQGVRTPPATASSDTPAPRVANGLVGLTSGGRRTTVTVYLTNNSFLARVPDDAERLLNPSQGARAARRAAQADPTKRSDSELVAASIAESSRNAALPMLRAAARPAAAQSESVQRLIASHGGEVISASPIPNQVTAEVSAEALAALERSSSVTRVQAAKTPVQMAAPIDGSSTWWANGFFGQGSSADGDGSPDVVVFDTGIRTTHTAFRSRQPGDCATCDGTGPTRVISPTIRSTFTGSKHANTIAEEIAGTAFASSSGGIAYGLDKLYDNYQANNPGLWDLGIASAGDPGLGGNSDLPEAINYSAGIYEDEVDLDPLTSYWDALESKFGILNTVSAGNCGIATPSFTNCGDGPHRVSAPGTNPNVITVGGLDTTTVYPDTSGYIPWANTSPGPTWGGRKKPDVIAPVFGTAGTPSQIDDNTWTSGGEGTSYAAPIAAAGSMLLASVGVYKPTAQKAIMINSATPVAGQTYWTPRSGWGALNLSDAFFQRGNYANGTVSGTGPNSARFFQITGASSGDRSTLVWNRRTNIDELSNPTNLQILGPTYYNLTNLDLSQFSSADPGTPTASGGSDAGDAVDTNQTVTTDNPMPGNSSDGDDNVEQVRSTGSGTQILKVKALSNVDGAGSEPFSISSARPLTALATPIPGVTLSVSPSPVATAQDVTVSATITNASSQLALSSVSVELSLPSGTSLEAGANPRSLGSISASGTTNLSWTVRGTTSGLKALSATATGTTFGEPFADTGSAEFTADGTPPTVNVVAEPLYSMTANPEINWSAVDADTAVASYDIEAAADGGAWTTVLAGTTATSVNIPASEGQVLHVRVRARDEVGNVSDWSETQTTIDAIEPAITFGEPSAPGHGVLTVPVSVTNIGAPIVSASYAFNDDVGGMRGALTPTVSYRNLGDTSTRPELTVFATDAAGGTVVASRTYTAPPRWLPLRLRISKIRSGRSKLTVSGTVAKGFTGYVTVRAKRSSRKGTRQATARVRARAGEYSVTLKVRRGSYRVTAETKTTGDYLSGSTAKRARVR